MKYIFSVLISIGTLSIISAQTVAEALRYSYWIPGSTARTAGVGGGFGAMGGDVGVLGINPAGLAEFRKSELTFTMAFNGGNTNSILGTTQQETSSDVVPSISNLSIVWVKENLGGVIESSNFSLGIQSYNNFNQSFAFSSNNEGSITERFSALANGFTPDELEFFESGLAFETGAIYDFDGDLVYETDFIPEDIVNKSQEVSRSGNINEANIAWAGRFNRKLRLGFSVGIPFFSFEEDKVYFENDIDDRIPFFNLLQYQERLSTSGVGVNFKTGIGYTVGKSLRLGLAYQTPSFFSMDDNFNTNLRYSFTEATTTLDTTSFSPDGRSDYRYRTPSRLTGSLGMLLNFGELKGFGNLDFTYLNYSKSKFTFSDDPVFEEELNARISNQLTSAVNLHAGIEMVYRKFRIRGGVGILGSPQADGDSEYVYSGGVGIRGDRIYLDVGYQLRGSDQSYSPYFVNDASRQINVTNESSRSQLSFTIGYKI